MAFNSFQFAGFFLFVWLVRVVLTPRVARHFAPRLRLINLVNARNAFLLVVSYLFYSAWDWRFLGLLMFSTANDYWVGRALEHESAPERRRLYVGVSLLANLGLLGFFKYYGFFASSFVLLAKRFGFDPDPHVLRVVLPVGISFYTFQSLSYTLDVYRRELKPERNLLYFATFVAFFPQLVAGPIERPGKLMPQFRHLRHVTWERVSSGCYLIAVGLFKKVVIADTVAKVANAAFALEQPSRVQVLMGVYAFAFQIYGDFSAYSDIARGTARCLGFDLSRNFDMPYLSATPSEFWRRWHISLSTWLRDYLYIALGGNRGSSFKTYRNLMLTMVLGGLWHGAAWTFVAWGTFHGTVLCVYRAIEPTVRAWVKPLSEGGRAALHVLAVVGFFQLTCISWLFFRAEDMTQALHFLDVLVTGGRVVKNELAVLGPVGVSAVLVTSLMAVQILQYWRRDSWLVFRAPPAVRGLVYAVCVLLLVWFGDDGGETFIYFQF